MPQYGELLEPTNGGGDQNWALIRSRDAAIPSPIEIKEFADFESGGKTKVTTFIDHRLANGNTVKIITNNTSNNAFNGTYTVDDAVSTEPASGNGYNGVYTFTIVRGGGHTACGVSGVRMIGPPVASITDAALFPVDTAGNANQTETTYITAASLISSLLTKSDWGAGAALTIDADQPATTGAEDSSGLHIDYDRAVAGSGTAAHNDIGIDLDVTTASLGSSSSIGMDIDVVGTADGTLTATGIAIDVSGGYAHRGITCVVGEGDNNNIGMILSNFNNNGDDFRNTSSANANDFFSINTTTNGATELETVHQGGVLAHLTSDVDGDIILDADGDNITMLAGGTGSGLDFIQSGTGDYTIKNLTSDKDIIFNVNDGGSDTELMRLNGGASTIDIKEDIKLTFGDAGEYIMGDGDDLKLATSRTVVIDSAITNTSAGTYTGCDINFIKTGSSTSDNTIYALDVQARNVTATNGINIVKGARIIADGEHAADAGTMQVTGVEINCTGSSSGSSRSLCLDLSTSGSDICNGMLLNNALSGKEYDIRIVSSVDAGDYFNILTTTLGATTISTVDDGDSGDGISAPLTLDIDGDIILESAQDANITIDRDVNFDIARDFSVDAEGKIVLDSDGSFIAKRGGTEFSVANSAYAGMILGYRTIGIDAADSSYSVTNAFVVVSDDHKVKFKAPPSGAVEIEIFIYADASSGGRPLKFGLSDQDASTGYQAISHPNATDVTNEHEVHTADESDEVYICHKWVVTGLTAGTAYEWWLGAACSHNLIYSLRWGGNVSGEFAPFIMKATALPTAVSDYAVYG